MSRRLAGRDRASAELPEGEQLFRTGKYAECARLAAKEIDEGTWEVDWHNLKAKLRARRGQISGCRSHTSRKLSTNTVASLRLRLLARTADLFNGNEQQAEVSDEEIGRLLAVQERFDSPADRVALGRFLLERGADPRQVLELIYDPLRKERQTLPKSTSRRPSWPSTSTTTPSRPKHCGPRRKRGRRSAVPLSACPQLCRRRTGPRQAASKPRLAINPRHVDSLLFRSIV